MDTARKLARTEIRSRAAEVDRTEEYPWDNVKKLTDAGFMGMTIPTELGGLGLTYMDAVLVVEEMAKVCGVTGRIVVEANMGAIGAIMKYGSEKQKNWPPNWSLPATNLQSASLSQAQETPPPK